MYGSHTTASPVTEKVTHVDVIMSELKEKNKISYVASTTDCL
jgi:hypothetical protein